MVVHAILSNPLINSRTSLYMLRVLRIAHHVVLWLFSWHTWAFLWSWITESRIAIPWWWRSWMLASRIMTLILAIFGVATLLLSWRWTILIRTGALSTSSCNILINFMIYFTLILSMYVLWSRAWSGGSTVGVHRVWAYLLLRAILMGVWWILIMRRSLFLASWRACVAWMLITMVTLISLRWKLTRLLLSVIANLSWAIVIVWVVGMIGVLATWMLLLLIFIIFSYQVVVAWRVTSSIELLLVSQLLFFAGMDLLVASHRTLEGSNPSSGNLVGVGCSSWTNSIWATILWNLTVITLLFVGK